MIGLLRSSQISQTIWGHTCVPASDITCDPPPVVKSMELQGKYIHPARTMQWNHKYSMFIHFSRLVIALIYMGRGSLCQLYRSFHSIPTYTAYSTCSISATKNIYLFYPFGVGGTQSLELLFSLLKGEKVLQFNNKVILLVVFFFFFFI